MDIVIWLSCCFGAGVLFGDGIGQLRYEGFGGLPKIIIAPGVFLAGLRYADLVLGAS